MSCSTQAASAPAADHAFVTESDKLLAGWLADNHPDTSTAPADLTPASDSTTEADR